MKMDNVISASHMVSRIDITPPQTLQMYIVLMVFISSLIGSSLFLASTLKIFALRTMRLEAHAS